MYNTLPASVSAESSCDEKQPVSPYFYNAEGKRDPFQLPAGMVVQQDDDESGKDVVVKPERVKEYLEKFQLDSLKLVAIIFHIEGQSSAVMMEDPEGKGHLVRIGQYVGVNEGRITNIEDGTVLIVEPIPSQTGKTRTITLRLHKKDGQ